MSNLEMWVENGELVKRPQRPDGTPYSNKVLLDAMGLVRIYCDDSGSHIQWNMGCANWASLIFAAQFVPACPAPFHLHYFKMGWFEELLGDVRDAVKRIEELILKADVRLSERAFTQAAQPSRVNTPIELQEAWETGMADDDRSIVCEVNPESELTQVTHVGGNSLIAKIWGKNPNSFPLMTGHSYDRTVTPNYFKVASTGRPHYDHVLASMLQPDGEVQWLAYHRVILPDLGLSRGPKRVRIVSELAPVGIRLL